MCGQYRDWYEALELDVYLLKLEYPLAFIPSFLFDHRSSRQALNKNFMIEMINRLMLIDLTQHTTRCSNRSDKSQEYLISRHAAVETEAELIQI